MDPAVLYLGAGIMQQLQTTQMNPTIIADFHVQCQNMSSRTAAKTWMWMFFGVTHLKLDLGSEESWVLDGLVHHSSNFWTHLRVWTFPCVGARPCRLTAEVNLILSLLLDLKACFSVACSIATSKCSSSVLLHAVHLQETMLFSLSQWGKRTSMDKMTKRDNEWPASQHVGTSS